MYDCLAEKHIHLHFASDLNGGGIRTRLWALIDVEITALILI